MEDGRGVSTYGQDQSSCNLSDNVEFALPEHWKQKAASDHSQVENCIRRIIDEQTDDSNSCSYESTLKRCTRKNTILDPFLVDELISNSPLKLQRIVRNLKSRQENNDLRRYIPHCIVLLGEPGVGKSTLAQAIAQYCSINSTIVELTNLHDQFKDSGSGSLNQLLIRVKDLTDLHILILNEMQCLVKKRNNNDFDEEAAKTLWSALDEFEHMPNILVIGTANEIKNLPKQLLSRLSNSIFKIEFPKDSERKRIMQYYLSIVPKHVTVNIDDNQLERLVKKTAYLAGRDLQKVVEEAWSEVDLNGPQLLDDDQNLVLNAFDIEKAIRIVKKNNGVFQPWYYTAIQDYIKPNIGIMLQIGIPLAFTLGFNYIMQQGAQAKQLDQNKIFHQEQQAASLAQNAEFHADSLAQSQIFQQQNFNQIQEYNKKQLELSENSARKNLSFSILDLTTQTSPALFSAHPVAGVGAVSLGLGAAVMALPEEERNAVIQNVRYYLIEKDRDIFTETFMKGCKLTFGFLKNTFFDSNK